MTLNGIMTLILRYFTEFGNFWGEVRKSGWSKDVVVKSLRSLSRLVMNDLKLTDFL